ncbi:LOW QUALITY PROTEIN: ras-interacting protein 1 [Falco rusticolus]|uniref:LOW QUALITY PROTEIN: ras-interacting protein 1 n=1 Tax=Falco rusticolus TaxID=120794 RepID=UPI001886A717|nr:LOW QUALITY PROTEIN: ras-interacting protein 1 [Falco rusticolus]
MFPEDRKEGSPRFGKLHFPVGLWINSPKKRLAKISRRWPSAGSVRSTSSDTTSRGSETVELRPAGKTKSSRHKRLSNLFHRTTATTTATTTGRWASEKKLVDLVDPEVLVGGDHPPGQRQLPGILKIFGGDISRGANYKSVLATPRSTARELVREALERYGLTPEEGIAGEYVLCDVVGRAGGPGGAWQVEYLRPLGEAERPLVLQDVWKPKSGCSRRFEIRRQQEVEHGCEGDNTETPGLNTPTRRSQKSRSRAASGGGPGAPPKDRADNLSLRRSISDMNLSTKRRRERKTVLSVAGGDPAPPQSDEGPLETPPPPPGEGGAAEEEAGEGAGLEQLAQCLIQPPQQHPYFLLLQGYGRQDFVIYVMTRPQHVFGRPERRGGAPEKSGGCLVDTFLNAPDILPRHCLVRAAEGGGRPPSPATVRPFRGAPVTHNGAPLLRPAPLHPGDLLGLGQHFLFLYKDPRNTSGGSPSPRPPWLPPARPSLGLAGVLGCPGCGRTPQERQEALRSCLESPRPELRYRPQEEEVLLREIVRLPEEGSGGGGSGVLGGLAPAFLLGLCLEHAARAFPPERFPPLLCRVALLVKETVWEKIKEIGDRQPENQQDAAPAALSAAAVAADLRPLLRWLANAMELLNLAQARVLELERELELEGPCPELTGDLETCDEALGVLDEVIMSTFQQSVYYLTKTLYSALPTLLESNPFSGAGEPSAGQDLASVPEGVRPTLAVFQTALELTRDCQLHPDLVSQTFGYLFFFSNASLFNTLMEKGSAGPFFQWWRAVRIRTNLDLVLDWLAALGLGDIAGEFFRKLSATANLLCTPRSCLSKASWSRLRAEFPVLSPAQLHHLLSHYQLGPGCPAPPAWAPPPEERDLVASGDIFESFSEHPPLLLPSQGFRLRLGEPVGDEGLLRPLCRLRRLLWDLEQGGLPANQRALGLEGAP